MAFEGVDSVRAVLVVAPWTDAVFLHFFFAAPQGHSQASCSCPAAIPKT